MNAPRIAVLLFALALALPLAAQEKKPAPGQSANTNMQILAEKIKADKKLVVAANMNLSEADGKKFWPLYDGYQKGLEDINKRTAKLITDYADAYNKDAVTDEVAKKLMPEMLAIEEAQVKLRRTYADKISHALSPKIAARYLQIEKKIRAIVDYALADSIPLVP